MRFIHKYWKVNINYSDYKHKLITKYPHLLKRDQVFDISRLNIVRSLKFIDQNTKKEVIGIDWINKLGIS